MSVASILQALAENAGRAQLQRGALIGGAVEDIGSLPARYLAGQDQKRIEALKTAQVSQQIALEQARGEREAAQAQRQVGLDQRAMTAQDAADMKEAALKQGIGAGFAKDPQNFDIGAAVTKLKEIGAEDLIPTIAAVHEKFQPKIGEAAAGTAGRFLTGPQAGQIVPNSQVPKEKSAPTGPELDLAAQLLYAKRSAGATLTPEEKASLQGYEDRKRVVSDPAQQAATERQTNTIAQQNAIQKKAQDFQVMQAARADIQKNADTPYQTARSSADELRSLVSQAQSGNKIAASQQALATAAATIRSFGLNRINMAEIGMPAGAGSAADKVSNFLGKWTEGQPVDPGLQKDMLAVADALEAVATKKYLETHTGINKLYGTQLPPTFNVAQPGASGPATGGGLTYQDYLNKKKSGGD